MSKVTASPPFVLIVFLVFLASEGLAGWDEAKLEQEEAMHLLPDYERGKKIFEICAICHMPEGWGTPNGAYPQIAGQHRSVVVKQLADIRARNRDNPSMYPFAIPEEIGGSQAISDVSHYIETLKMTTATGKGEGADLQHGEKIYQQYCTECHGNQGEGDPLKAYPSIHGQHYNYLLRQLIWLQDGRRRNGNQEMVKIIKKLSMRDFKAVSDYVSRLLPVKNKRSPLTWVDRNKIEK